MTIEKVPFNAVRAALYGWEELLDGFDLADPASFGCIRDFEIYKYFALTGQGAADATTSLGEALHDNSIQRAVLTYLLKKDKVVGIMGDHLLPRSDPAYAQVAELARRLAREGFLIASGGGPGAMEAAHFGAAFSRQGRKQMLGALALLADPKVAALPDSRQILDPSTGQIDLAIAAQLHAWLSPAAEIMRGLRAPVESLAVPTWQYGTEPFMPFATHVAKYFQNSLREDGLLSLAAGGIVFAKGKSGTLQEVFQDAAKNYNKTFGGRFAPMVFLGKTYWTETLPVRATLGALYAANGMQEDFGTKVLFTDDVAAAADHIRTFGAPQAAFAQQWEAKYAVRA